MSVGRSDCEKCRDVQIKLGNGLRTCTPCELGSSCPVNEFGVEVAG